MLLACDSHFIALKYLIKNIMGGCHVPARLYVPASLDHLRVEGHDLRDAQGRTGA